MLIYLYSNCFYFESANSFLTLLTLIHSTWPRWGHTMSIPRKGLRQWVVNTCLTVSKCGLFIDGSHEVHYLGFWGTHNCSNTRKFGEFRVYRIRSISSWDHTDKVLHDAFINHPNFSFLLVNRFDFLIKSPHWLSSFYTICTAVYE